MSTNLIRRTLIVALFDVGCFHSHTPGPAHRIAVDPAIMQKVSVTACFHATNPRVTTSSCRSAVT
jgi:hypothetical protein